MQEKSKTWFGKWIHDVAYSFILNISYGLQQLIQRVLLRNVHSHIKF